MTININEVYSLIVIKKFLMETYLIILIYIQMKRTAHFRPILIRLSAPGPLKIFAVWIMLCYLKLIKTHKMNIPTNSARNGLRLLI